MPLLGIKTPFLVCPAHCLVTILTELFWLQKKMYTNSYTQIIHVFQNKCLKAVAEYAEILSECISYDCKLPSRDVH